MTPEEARSQFDAAKANSILGDIQQAAEQFALPVDLLLAIASRETNITNELGDGGHGVGVMQIDVRYHPIAQQMIVNGRWQKPAGRLALIRQGAKILAGNVAAAQDHIHDPNQALRVATAGYNCGIHNAIVGHYEGDCDAYTTGHNYSADVFARRALFAALLKEG